jgi:hypothetical protein
MLAEPLTVRLAVSRLSPHTSRLSRLVPACIFTVSGSQPGSCVSMQRYVCVCVCVCVRVWLRQWLGQTVCAVVAVVERERGVDMADCMCDGVYAAGCVTACVHVSSCGRVYVCVRQWLWLSVCAAVAVCVAVCDMCARSGYCRLCVRQCVSSRTHTMWTHTYRLSMQPYEKKGVHKHLKVLELLSL